MLAGGSAIFVLVMGLLITALRRQAAPQGEGKAGTRLWMWGLGLGFPILTLATLTGYGLFIGERLLPR